MNTAILNWKLSTSNFAIEREIICLLAQMDTVLYFSKLMFYNNLPLTYNKLMHFSKNELFKNLDYSLDFASLSHLKHCVCPTSSPTPFEKDGEEFCLMCLLLSGC